MSYASFMQCTCGNRQQVLRHPERLRHAECTDCRRILEVHPGDFRLYAKSTQGQDHPDDRVLTDEELAALIPALRESEGELPSRTLGYRELILSYLHARHFDDLKWGPAGYHWAHFHALAAALDVPLPDLLEADASHNKPFDVLKLVALRQFQGIDRSSSNEPHTRSFAPGQVRATLEAWLACRSPFDGYLGGNPFSDFGHYYQQVTQSQATYRDALVSYAVRLLEFIYGPRRNIPASFLGEWGDYDPSFEGDGEL